jgi:TRAP-type C4-dicarboxylate transport system permease small subunit
MESGILVLALVLSAAGLATFGGLTWACWYYFKKQTGQAAKIALGIFMAVFGFLAGLVGGCGALFVGQAVLDQMR